MSDMRLFLRYEISGLMMCVASSLLILGFLDLSDLEHLISGFVITDYLGFVVLISLPTGWLAYQLFEEFAHPHTKTSGYLKMQKIFEENDYNDQQLMARVDFSLRDAYKEYPYLPETLAGHWNNYYARCVVGWGVLITSLLTLFAIIFIKFPWSGSISRPESALAIVIIFMAFSYSKRVPDICENQLLIFLILIAIIYFMIFCSFFCTLRSDIINVILVGLYLIFLLCIFYIFIKLSRIYMEVDAQECLFIDQQYNFITRKDGD